MNKKITAKRLFILWVVTYCLFGMLSHIYVIYETVATGVSPIYLLSGHQILTLLLVMLFFIPLMFAVLYYAKREKSKKLIGVSVFFLIFLSVWSVGMLTLTVNAWLAS